MDKIESLLVDIMELKLLTNKNHINNSNEFNNKIKEVKNLIEDIPLDSCFSTDSDIIFSCKFSKFLYRNTFRKTSYNTMFVHAYKVAEILYRNNASKETVIAGLLHDVIEDTPYKEYILRIFFNDVIMNTVLFHTEDKSKSWEIRKLTTI
ncbi:HD domain-containing protein, partial [Sutterella wadsworthensis]|uniref:HD domain-containing protein n=1 Tax=Sutterella wadsworthensis TaxID=40545 RepID=UPI0032C01872